MAQSLNNLALLLQDQGKLDDALPLRHECLAIGKKVLGEEHPDVAVWLNNLAGLLKAQVRTFLHFCTFSCC